jgi:hypothetical protein
MQENEKEELELKRCMLKRTFWCRVFMLGFLSVGCAASLLALLGLIGKLSGTIRETLAPLSAMVLIVLGFVWGITRVWRDE